MRNLTWKEFSDLIKIGYRQIIEEDYNITTEAGFYAMKTTNYEFRGKIIFDKKVNFQGVKLKFSNVEFKDDLNIDSLSNLNIDYCIANIINVKNGDNEIEILGGKISNLYCTKTNRNKLLLQNVELTRFRSDDSSFSELSFIGSNTSKIKIEKIDISRGNIDSFNFFNAEIGNKVDYESSVVDESACFVTSALIINLNIKNSIINYKAEIKGTVERINLYEKLNIDELNLNGEIRNIEFNNNVTVQCVQLNGKLGNLKINESSIIEQCIVNCTINGNFEIAGGRLKKLKLDKDVYASKIIISGGYIDEFLIESKELKNLFIKPKKKIEIQKIHQTVFVEHLFENEKDLLKIGIIEFSNYNIHKEKESKYIGLKINELKFINISNYGNIVFSNLRPWILRKAKVTIVNSDLGKILLMDCDFTEFQMQFSSSRISEIFLAGTNMPKNEFINTSTTNKSNHDQRRLALTQIKKIYENRGDLLNATHYHEAELMDWLAEIKTENNKNKERKLIYSQLKKMYEVRGDSIQVVKYHGLELDMQREIIKGDKGGFWEIFQLWLNKKSNNFGQSWQSALGYLLIINFFFYFFYLLSLGLICQKTSIDFNLFGYYFEFLNPTHKIDFIKNNEGLSNLKINGFAVFLDFFNRIFVGFLIYQLVSAFRKYGKK